SPTAVSAPAVIDLRIPITVSSLREPRRSSRRRCFEPRSSPQVSHSVSDDASARQIHIAAAHREGRMSVMARTWTVGVDAGGTWVRALATDARGRRRAVRVRATMPDDLGRTLARIWQRWRVARGDVARLVVATAG